MRPILNYHAVGTTRSPAMERWTISTALFAEHLDLLEARGLRGVTVAAALAEPSPDQVALTFDDGFEDFATLAAPELRRRGFGASFYVVTGDVGGVSRWLPDVARPMVSWDQLRELDALGFEIGAHSHTHPQLDLLGRRGARAEIRTSRRLLGEQLGHEINGFCYPHGFYTNRVRQEVVNAGFTYSCAVRHKMSNPSDDRFSLARIVIDSTTSVEQLSRWLDGQTLRQRGTHIERQLAAAFRTYRRLRRYGHRAR